MKDKKEKQNKENNINIDLGMGKISLGGLFNGIEKLIDLASDLKDSGDEIKKSGNIDFGHIKKGMKGVFGFSIKTATGGKPVVERFGNIKKTEAGPEIEDEREPITDVFDEKAEIIVYVEMPGVNPEDIKLDLKDDILDISAQSNDRKYRKELLLAAKVKPGTLKSNYKNGILEIRMEK